MKFYLNFFLFWCALEFWASWTRIPLPDPDQLTQLNPDPDPKYCIRRMGFWNSSIRDIQRLSMTPLLFSVAQGIFWLSIERLSRSTLPWGEWSLFSCTLYRSCNLNVWHRPLCADSDKIPRRWDLYTYILHLSVFSTYISVGKGEPVGGYAGLGQTRAAILGLREPGAGATAHARGARRGLARRPLLPLSQVSGVRGVQQGGVSAPENGG